MSQFFFPFHSGHWLTATLSNSEDPDEMPHDKVAFHLGLYCLLRSKQIIIRDRNASFNRNIDQQLIKIQNGQFHTILILSTCMKRHQDEQS